MTLTDSMDQEKKEVEDLYALKIVLMDLYGSKTT